MMTGQVVLWVAMIAVLALSAVVFREARLLRGLYQLPRNQGNTENG